MLHQHKETLVSGTSDHREWHRGRTEYAVWLIALGSPETEAYVEAARRHLSEFLLKPYLRQPHITLFVCGFPTGTPCHDDDYGTDRFHAQLQQLQGARIGRFSIRIGALNSFASAPFFEVEDPEGGIERIRTVLSGSAPEIGREGFIPHVTIGLYSGRFCSGIVDRKIGSFASVPQVVSVQRIVFATYEAKVLAGPLSYRREVML